MIKHPFKSPIFLISSTLFLLHQLLQYGLEIHIAFADNYLDNLLAMPIVLTLLFAERKWLLEKGTTYRLPLLDIVLTTLYISIISEFVFPRFSNRFTFDWLDFFFYFAGAALYLYSECNSKAKCAIIE